MGDIMNTKTADQIHEYNVYVLTSWKVNDNVVLTDHLNNKTEYGHVTGFAANCFGELVVRVRTYTSSDPDGTEQCIHPLNKVWVMTKV